MGSILPEAMTDNPRWRLAVPQQLWAHTPYSARYAKGADGNLVAPWSAKNENIGQLDSRAAETAAREHLCSACGEPLLDVAVFLKNQEDTDQILEHFDLGTDVHHVEPPLHLECAGYAALACPHIRNERWNAIIATKWDSDERCEDCKNPEFWPDLSESYEILSYNAFIERTRKSPK